MTTETYGIENLENALDVALAIPFQAIKTFKNKFNFFDVLAFVDEVRKLSELIKQKKEVGLELKDLSPEERLQLIEIAKAKFDLPDDKAEAFVEYALSWVNSTVILCNMAKDLKK